MDEELSYSRSLMAGRRSAVALRRALTGVARHQAGYFTAGQALAVGYSYPAQRYHTRQGDWLRVDRGIYRLPDWPVTQHEDLARWTLWSRGRAVVSHETALAVHELRDVMPAQVDLTVPPGFRSRSPGVILHLGSVGETDMEQFDGFAITTSLRSILDAAAVGMQADQLARVIGEALDRGLVTIGAIRARDHEFGPRAAVTIEKALQQATP
jgi:predicted transcriptional regulator of viral defense system